MVENIDTNVGRILAQLHDWNLDDNTIVILATDQGVSDRGAPHPRPAEKRSSDSVAYDEHHLVFCMIRDPGVTKAGSNGALAGMVDIAPTVLDLCGLPKPDSMDGRSLRPLLEGATKWSDDRTLIIQCPRTRERAEWRNAVVKTQQWRLVGGDRLYDATTDWGEEHNVAGEHPDVVARLTADYLTFWNSLPPETELLSRAVLGSPRAPDVRLDCMDWYEGAAPWTQQGLLKHSEKNGLWAVEVARDGRYQFELRYLPREANGPIGAVGASVRVGPDYAYTEISPEADKAVMELSLHKGKYDLETTFRRPPDQPGDESWGAYFVYVSYLGE